MAGWTRYNEDSGEVETGMYDYPFMVRATYRIEQGREAETVASFRTKEQAERWVAQNGADYKVGPNGCRDLRIENWNE